MQMSFETTRLVRILVLVQCLCCYYILSVLETTTFDRDRKTRNNSLSFLYYHSIHGPNPELHVHLDFFLLTTIWLLHTEQVLGQINSQNFIPYPSGSEGMNWQNLHLPRKSSNCSLKVKHSDGLKKSAKKIRPFIKYFTDR